MKIGYVTTYDASDVRNWSGLGYYIGESLKSPSTEVRYIGSLREEPIVFTKAKQRILGQLTGKRYMRDRNPIILKSYASQVQAQLSGIDVVFSVGTIPIAYLDCKQPIAFWTDATFAGMLDFYPTFTNLQKRTIAEGMAAEQAAFDRAKLVLYSSDWAAKSAIDHYRLDAKKVKVVPFGANVACDRSLEQIKTIVGARPPSPCRLLFLGVEWDRKGGDIAYAVAQALNQSGLPTQLTIIGCDPPARLHLPEFVHPLGFVSKSTVTGRKIIDQALAEAHFLILPSRSEAFGVAFVEANSFGVPCLATNVGGIPTVIKDGRNGKTFPVQANPEEYCHTIRTWMEHYDDYKRLALSSFQEYESRLNWSVAGQTVRKLLQDLV